MSQCQRCGCSIVWLGKVPVLTPVLANEVTEQMRRDGVDFTQQDDDVQLHYYSDCKQENP